jgi:hypothetical protein
MRIRSLLIAIAVVVLLPGPMRAQDVVLSAAIRSRIESWNWFGPGSNGEYTYAGFLGRAGLSSQGKRFGWRAELAAPLLLGLPDDAAAAPPSGQLGAGATYWVTNDSATTTGSVFLKQAFVRVGSSTHNVRAGRFEFSDGTERPATDSTLVALKRERIAHRLLGNFAWSHVQRSLDGLQYSLVTPEVTVTAAAARPTEGVFSTNGWRSLDVDVLYASAARAGAGSDSRAFAVYYRDHRDRVVMTDNRPAAVRSAEVRGVEFATLGAHHVRVVDVGAARFDMLAWVALQKGTWGTLSHRAYSWVLEAGVQPDLPGDPWLRIGHTQASGDGDPDDDRHTTFHPMLPTPRMYARFPFYNQMNLSDTYASLVVKATPQLALRSEMHLLQLARRQDLWYGGGGAYDDDTFGVAGRPSGGVTDLGSIVDLSAQLNLSRAFSVHVYYGRADPGDVVRRINGEGNASLGYVELEWRR